MDRARHLLDGAANRRTGGEYRLPHTGDMAALMALEESARWLYWFGEAEGAALLAGGLGRVWLLEDRLQAVLLADHDGGPIAHLRTVMVRARDDLAPFVSRALPEVEAQAAAAGARWCAVVVPPEWLSRCLAARGYVLAAEIVNYRLRRPCPGVLGNADVLVRQAELADQDAMLAVDRDAFVPLWRYPASQMADNLAACRQRLVAVEGGAVIGYLLAAQQGDHLHINRVAVHPIWQGRGVGLRLMTTALDTAYRDGVAAVTLNTQADNRASRRLYEQLGFTAAPQQLPFWTHDLFTVNDKDSVTELQPH